MCLEFEILEITLFWSNKPSNNSFLLIHGTINYIQN